MFVSIVLPPLVCIMNMVLWLLLNCSDINLGTNCKITLVYLLTDFNVVG